MQFNTKSSFYPKQNLFSFEKYAEMHMHMNGMMYEELGCYSALTFGSYKHVVHRNYFIDTHMGKDREHQSSEETWQLGTTFAIFPLEEHMPDKAFFQR
jgi:hypothetical protein